MQISRSIPVLPVWAFLSAVAAAGCTPTDNKGGSASDSDDPEGTTEPPDPDEPNRPPDVPDLQLGPDEATTADALVASLRADPRDPDGDAVTVHYVWSVDGVRQSDLDDATLIPAERTAKGQTWEVIAESFDGTDYSERVSASLVVADSPPSLVVTLAPEAPVTTDALVLTVETSDPDDDPLDVSIIWSVDDDTEAPADVDTISAADTVRGQTWTATVTVEDGIHDPLVETASVVIGNAPPTVDALTLSPEAATSSDTLLAEVEASDPDGDPVALTWTWTADGVVIADETADTLDAAQLVRGAEVVAHVTPFDGFEDGVTVSSDTMVIDNSPPSLTGVRLDTGEVYEATTVTCLPEGWADADDDPESVVVEWWVDGVSAGTGSTLDGSAFDKGQQVGCTATPDDGLDTGETVESEMVTVRNTPPTLSDASLDNLTPQEADVVGVVLGTTSDDDGDTVSVRYAWYVDGDGPVHTGSTLDGDHFNQGSTIQVVVTPTDGSASGDPVTSDVATGANTLPTVSAVSLSPASLYTEDTLTASVSVTDPDPEDELSLELEWSVEGLVVQTGEELELASSFFERDDSVTVTVTPTDATGAGAPYTSSAVTVLNTPPPAPSVSFASSPHLSDTELVCLVTAAEDDADGDTVDYAIAWAVGGSPWTGTTSTTTWTDDTIPVSALVDDDVWTCTATPDDGDDTGPAVAASVTITDCPSTDALEFDGASVATLGGQGLTDRSQGTLEMWVYPTSDEGTLFAITRSAGTSNRLEVRLDGGAVQFVMSTNNSCGSANSASAATLPLDEWSHLAVVANGTRGGWEVYIDGVGETVASSAGGWGSCMGNEQLRLGAAWRSSAATDHFIGFLDDVRIWSTARSASEIAAGMNDAYSSAASDPDLLAWYSLDDYNGGTLVDETGAHDGAWGFSDSWFQTVDFCVP